MHRHASPHVFRAAAALLVTIGVTLAEPTLGVGVASPARPPASRPPARESVLTSPDTVSQRPPVVQSHLYRTGSLASTSDAPIPRYGQTAILDTLRHRMLMFGGEDLVGFKDETWAMPLDGTMPWQFLPPSATAIKRALHNAVLDPVNDRMVVFGGSDSLEWRNDVWVYPLSGNGTWSPLAVAGTPPPPRQRCSAVLDPVRNRLIVFGGLRSSNEASNDVWALSLYGTPTWTLLLPSGARPVPRFGATAVYDPPRDRMIVFGGVDGGGSALGDVRAVSLGSSPAWTFLVPADAGPSARTEAKAVYDPARDVVWLFGGGTSSGLPNDLWTLSLSGTPAWHLMSPNGQIPTGRYFFSAILDPATDRMLISMGNATGGPLGDNWILHLTGTPTWTLHDTSFGPPAPTFVSVPVIPDTLRLGQILAIHVGAVNNGGGSDDGRIAIAFPTLTGPGDGQWVSSTSCCDDSPGYTELPAGSSLLDAGCQPMAGGYLVAEYRDSDWLGHGGETNGFDVTVQPQVTGFFYADIRATLHEPGAGCSDVTAVPGGGVQTVADQQGFQVMRFAVYVAPAPPPLPEFTGPVGIPSTVSVGQSFTITTSVRNIAGPSDDGRIVVSFPTLTSPDDGQRITHPAGDDTPGYTLRPAGSSLVDSNCQSIAAGYLVAEYDDSSWPGFGTETNDLSLTVQPPALGTFYVDVRSAMHDPAATCTDVNAVPGGGVTTATDQQGFQVTRFAVEVGLGPPTPRFTAAVAGIPSTLLLGQSFTMTMSVRNDGAPSDDGRIVVSLPMFTLPDDGQRVAGTGGDDAPGYIEHPAGSNLLDASCQAITSGYLTAEYDDSDWSGYGAETNDLSLTVQPQWTGKFYVDVRATLHTPNSACGFWSAVPAGGAATVVDPQGFQVTRFEVQVITPPSTIWSTLTLPGSGPSPRISSSMVYHPGRDALVLYGGSDQPYQYLTDSWVLPLAPGGSWTPLTPGGPIPRSRINQSMILNPVEDHLVVFGGFHGAPLNDLTALALSPLVWWFPATPSGPQPSPRLGQSAVYDPLRHRMLVIGGYGDDYFNDVWEYQLPGNGTWTQLNPSGTPMPPRAQHAAIYDPVRDRVLVFGGDGGTSLNDVWELRLGGTLIWNQIVPSGPLPVSRREHTMIYDPARDRLVVFGGVNLGVRLNDVWALPLGNPPTWTQLFSSTAPPSPRMEHAAVYDPMRDRMIVFGGDVGTNQFSNELWALSFDAPTPTQVSFGGAEVSAERVRLTWVVPDASGLQADVERCKVAGQWTVLGGASLEGDRLVFEDRDVEPGTRYGYRLVARAPDPGSVLDEQWVTVPPRAVLALAGASPNPAPDNLWVAFSLPDEHRTTLELFDLKGRLIEQREVGALGIGAHRVALSESRRLPAGVYLVRLVRADRTLTAKACVVR